MRGVVICIQGPTASGKSELAEELASRLDGEIVSADSMQVYRGMDVGTAKVPAASRAVPYHCIDILDPGEPYSASLFQRDAREAIEGIWSRGKEAVLCGGTWLYVRAVLEEMDFAAGELAGNEVRARYEGVAEREGPEALHRILEERDPESAAAIHPNNVRRVVRALEMNEEGESYAERKRRFKAISAHYPSVKLGLRISRELLYERIDDRVDEMFSHGLVEEVRGLLEAGFREGLTAPQAIGYKEVVASLDGECTLEEARDAIAQSTRRFAKRQMSWLRSDSSIHWIDADGGVDEAVVGGALECIERYACPNDSTREASRGSGAA